MRLGGTFGDRKTGAGKAVGGVRFAFGKEGLPVAFVAFRLTDGHRLGPGQAAYETFQVRGVLAGGVDADVKMRPWLAGDDFFKSVAQLGVAILRFDEIEGLESRLAIFSQEVCSVPVAGRVDTDSEGHRGGRVRLYFNRGHGKAPKNMNGTVAARVRRASFDMDDPCDERSIAA
ncbi:MAG TPA: hypothetical protein VMV69_26310 [Pirellulales bacterium]|nr:hypothetical protein [Pirellulales bacterium]